MSTESADFPEKKRKNKSHTTESHPAKKIKKSFKEKSKSSQHSLQGDGASSSRQEVQIGQSTGDIASGATQHVDKQLKASKAHSKDVDANQEQPGGEKRSKKKDKKEKTKNQVAVIGDSATSSTTIAVRPSVKEKSVQPTKPSSLPTRSWQLSEPIGGHFRSIDPCYSLDERHMLIATRRSLNVYSLSSSLLLRRITISNTQTIVDLKLSKSNPDLVFVVVSDGTISLWNWSEGDKLASVNYGCKVFAFDVAAVEEFAADTLFLIVKSREGQVSQSHIASVMFAHRQTANSQASLDQLSATYNELSHIQVLDQGRVIFAASETTLVIGWSPRRRGKEFKDQEEILKHQWKVVGFPEGLSCFDARYFPNTTQSKDIETKTASTKPNSFSIAIGSKQGIIYVYSDILDIFRDDKKSLKPRKLHWHRHPVGSLKWSLDGNYVISGGQETVLNIWQMETNRKQDLPHLTSSIQRLTVSPSGTSYALRLADNSVIVLSTSELKPKAVMSSIQSRSSTDIHKWLDKDLNILQTAAIENRLSPNQILVAVPASSDGFAAGQAPPTPFLQTFDISVGRHVSRQALTRNNAINVDKGGSGNKIEEANVYMMQTTADGLWLATAEEWMPPATDICSLIGEPDINSIQKELEERRETFLKFWKWDSIKNQWGLHARVDSPHVADSEPYINRILDLVAFPDRTGFATIGEDRMIRLWRPKSRLKDGTIIRGVVKDSLTTWSCSKSMELERIAIGSELEEDTGKFEIPRRAKLAISADGSVLAVSLNDTQEFEPGLKAPGLTHFYDCDTGERKFTSPDLYIRDLAGMQFLGQHLIILSEDLHVWDMVSNKLKFGYNLYQNGGRPQGPLRLLAANEKLGTFAVAFTRVNDVEVSTRILVFDTTSAKPLLLTDLPGVVTALMSSDSTSGFITIDAEAEVRLIQPTTNQTILPHMLGQATDSVTEEDEIMGDADDESDVEVIEDTSAGAADIEGSDDESDVDMDRPVIRGNQLAKLFEGTTSHALPPVQDLFHAVAKLYIGRAGVK